MIERCAPPVRLPPLCIWPRGPHAPNMIQCERERVWMDARTGSMPSKPGTELTVSEACGWWTLAPNLGCLGHLDLCTAHCMLRWPTANANGKCTTCVWMSHAWLKRIAFSLSNTCVIFKLNPTLFLTKSRAWLAPGSSCTRKQMAPRTVVVP